MIEALNYVVDASVNINPGNCISISCRSLDPAKVRKVFHPSAVPGSLVKLKSYPSVSL